MPTVPTTTYDAIAYPGQPLPQAHPDLLATIATLHGLSPAPPSSCRTLELGCGDGANLVPLAYLYPGGRFLGIDLAPSPIERGRAVIAELGLGNVELRCGDIMDLAADLGTFDYIIAHGLYSWVPAPVRDRILAIARDHLAPHGVAYVSYNAYPGAHVRQMLRGMLRFHTRSMTEPRRRIDQARALARFLADGQTAAGPYGELLREETRRAAAPEGEALLFHDDLAEVNHPVWFHEFAGHAAAFGLRFLAEAHYFESSDRHLPPTIRDALAGLGREDVVLREQYLDFLKCRRFRQSLLVHQEAPAQREPNPAKVSALAVASAARPETAPDGATLTFRTPSGAAIAFDLPLAKAALLHLTDSSPEAMPFPELLAATSARLGTDADAAMLAAVLLESFAVGVVELFTEPLRFAVRAGERPEVSAVARQQLRAGQKTLTNLRHAPVTADHPLTRQLLALMDGTRDRTMLLDELTAWAVAHPPTGQASLSPEEVRQRLAGLIEPGLGQAAALALIM